ncbi:spermatogenesis-associated protein 17 isoform X2 [Hippocampus comes]|uniref:spermatogenesis-associated protein 17 isoform X2 n=1 Tax=Hippocampus comes TaxID=109280 RepID=UPI00094EFC6D|nr:PREDICTED: spermatogenesis-associated protein 17 isoform X2 [Hippocampus comes]
MAELLQIQCVLEEFRKLQFYKSRLEEATRQQEYRAALRIQSWFRGYRVRFYIRHLHEKAVIIQKIWRGFRARARCRQMVMEAYFVMKMNFYNEMAIRIQRRWRGFYVRKGEMDQLEELQKKERVCLKKVKEQKAKLYQAYRWHHLLSTKRCPGVFNSPFRLAPHEMELLLRQVKYQAPTKLVPRDCTPLTPAAPTLPSFHETVESPRSKTRAGCSPRPIPSRTPSTKQQVRIRDPGEMWEPSVHFPELFAGLHSSCAHLDEAQNDLRAYSGTSEPESMHHHLDHNSIGILHPSNVQTFA